MLEVVTNTTRLGNTQICIFANATEQVRSAKCGMACEPIFKPTHIRQWRKHLGMSLDELARAVPMDKGNLSKVERGLLQYNQDTLERIAKALGTDAASLIARDPTEGRSIWTIWDAAPENIRDQIERVANALIFTDKTDTT